MQKILKVLLVAIIIFALVVAGGVFYITQGLDEGVRQVINSVDISSIPDGEYNGTYEAGRWTNEMRVTVKDHIIVKIDVVKDVLFSKPEVTEEIIISVIDKQNVDVEAVSGATVTAKAYLKSIENALSKAN